MLLNQLLITFHTRLLGNNFALPLFCITFLNDLNNAKVLLVGSSCSIVFAFGALMQ